MKSTLVCFSLLISTITAWTQNVVQNPSASQTINQPTNTTLDLNSWPVRVFRDIEPIAPAPQDPTLFPMGNDLSLNAHGTADLILQNVPLEITSSTSVSPGVHNITVNSTQQLCPQGDHQGHPLCGIIVDPNSSQEEQISSTGWVIIDSTTINAAFSKSHTAPFKVRQVGVMAFKTRTIYLSGYPGDPGGRFVSLVDKNGQPILSLPNDVNSGIPTFAGSLSITGTLYKAAGSFRIDDPLDPANKYLQHSFVESPDMMNVYNGTVLLDGKGEADVVLPRYFEALNRDFRYQLTCIGEFAPIYVSEEIVNNHFRIAGGVPGLKVSWQVTGIRKDPYAQAHRIKAETLKPAAERGRYLNPELYSPRSEKPSGQK
jgi:hypothetical protein